MTSIISFQENCDCNEPCSIYTKITTSPSGNKLIKIIVNKCSKSSKKNICEYFSTKLYSEEPVPLVRETNSSLVNNDNKKTEFEKIKEEILSSIEELKSRQQTNTSTYIPLEKITAFCFRIKIRPFNSNNETLDSFKERIINFIPKTSIKAKPITINMIPDGIKDLPCFRPKIKNSIVVPKKKNTSNIVKNKGSCLMYTKSIQLVKGSTDDETDEEDHSLDIDEQESEDELDENIDAYDEKDIDF